MLGQWLHQLRQGRDVLPAKAIGDFLTDLEEALILSDVGVSLASRLMEVVQAERPTSEEQALHLLRQSCEAILAKAHAGEIPAPAISSAHPLIVMVVGVNGAGKTTLIGKLAHYYRQQAGQSVLIGAGDTFRAAAHEQLAIWSERAGATVIMRPDVKDSAAVLFDTLIQAKQNEIAVSLLDTAGRLPNHANLMEELHKVRRVVEKALPQPCRFERWLVLDATTGQNALQQAALFNEAVGLTGIVLTKWDGTAKGGVVLTLADQYRLPVVWMGIGERLSDLQAFEAETFLNRLFDI